MRVECWGFSSVQFAVQFVPESRGRQLGQYHRGHLGRPSEAGPGADLPDPIGPQFFTTPLTSHGCRDTAPVTAERRGAGPGRPATATLDDLER